MAELHPTAPPAIEGLRVRTYTGREDIEALCQIVNAANRADGVTDVWVPEALRIELEDATHGDPREDVLVATIDEQPVAWAQLEWSDTPDGDRHYWSVGHVHPDWRRRGIGGALLALSEERRRAAAAGHDHPGRRVLVSWVDDGDRGGRALLAELGYACVRYFHHMVRPDLEEPLVPPMPDGLESGPSRPISSDRYSTR